jgi:hypothetical protein
MVTGRARGPGDNGPVAVRGPDDNATLITARTPQQRATSAAHGDEHDQVLPGGGAGLTN